MIVDASVLLQVFFPDEIQPKALALVREHVAGYLHLKAPTLLPYEIENALWQAERRSRVNRTQAEILIQSFASLDIEIISQSWGELLPLARQYNRTVYDAAYLALALRLGEPLITADLRLYNSVHSQLDWVIYLGDYPGK